MTAEEARRILEDNGYGNLAADIGKAKKKIDESIRAAAAHGLTQYIETPIQSTLVRPLIDHYVMAGFEVYPSQGDHPGVRIMW